MNLQVFGCLFDVDSI